MSWQARTKIITTRRKPQFTKLAKKAKVVRENTYLREPQSHSQLPPKPSSKYGWLVCLVPFILIGLFYYLSGLTIAGIEIPTTKNFKQDEVKAMFETQKKEPVALFFDQTNLLFFNSDELKNKLNDNYQFYTLKVKKNYRKLTVALEFVEKDINLVWREGESYYYINYAGEIIVTKSVAGTVISKELLLIANTGDVKKDNRRINIDEKYLRFASALNDALKVKARGLNNRQIAVGKEYNTVSILLANGPEIKFNTEASIDDQLFKLESLRRATLSDGQIFNRQKYIDLRYAKAIYYK